MRERVTDREKTERERGRNRERRGKRGGRERESVCVHVCMCVRD